jgi:hypothetical protein
VAVLEAALESCLEISRSYLERPRTDVAEVLSHLVQMTRERPEVPAFLTEVYVFARHAPELLDIVQRQQNSYRQRVRASLESTGLKGDDDLIEVVLAIGDGLMYQRVIFGEGHTNATEAQPRGAQRQLMALLFQQRVGSLSQELQQP